MKEPSGQRHKEFEDTLRGWITVHYDPLKSTELLKPNNNRRWPIRRVMYAHALALAALCEGDLKMAQQANAEMTIAKERLVDEVPLAVTTELWVLTVLYSLTEEPEQRVKIKGIADKIASNLDGHPEYWLCQNLRCHYYTLTDDTSLKELYEEKVQNNWVSSLDSTYFYRIGEDSKALRYLKDDFRDMPHARISSACIAAELRKIKEARKVYDEIDENWNVRQYRARAIDILLYLGDLKEAKEAADKIIEESEDDYNHTFVALKRRLDLISANRKSTADLEKMILKNSPSQTDKCMGYYTLGLICLARNEEAAAKGFFKTAVDCNQFIYPQHEMAKALLKRRFGSTNDEN
jgi:tetratricopeptide (TPR) repeat protein